ncbi:DUF2946 family protein [Crenobacter cavernae]|uniref:DUF2946 family protein n=1 Tax=Crenobacter cavernae TaxID=2290923 RepID=A0ABY0FBG0_9NEIS|nr:DUF2946 family protein [Crenobacter cavernae]RXZ43375.1 DUF2946 family protein [Crenobacter cavernae]
MDAMVLAAIAKWPDVPACYGWLALDARGAWRIAGERVMHAGLAAFFSRNYEVGQTGEAYVQNGPQRAYVTLEDTPYVARVEASGTFRRLPDGVAAEAAAVWLSDDGVFYVELEGRLARVHDHDTATLAELLVAPDGAKLADAAWDGWPASRPDAAVRFAAGSIPLAYADATTLAERFGVVREPAGAA